MLSLSGLGPKKVRLLWRQLGIEDLEALRSAVQQEKVRTLKGFGAKSEERILKALESHERNLQRSNRKFAPSKGSSKPSAPKTEIELSPRSAPKGEGILRCGTSGFAYKEWRGSFYPKELSESDFLSDYARQFNTVEINNTFYRFPSEATLRQWQEAAGEGFLFAVKANQRITHRDRLKNVDGVTTRFLQRCESMGRYLGPILFQLPKTLKEDQARLDEFLSTLPSSHRYAIEFRHPSWFNDQTYSRLTKAEVSMVVHDDEEHPTPRIATSHFVYVRLRRDDYPSTDVESINKWLGELTSENKDVFLYIKHDEGGRNPRELLDPFVAANSPRRKVAGGQSRAAAKRRKA